MDLSVLIRRGRRARTIGIDDSPFERGRQRDVLVAGAVYSGGEFEGLLTSRVRQDGHNATDRLAQMLASSKFRAQLHLVLLDGITFGGFNVVDLPLLAHRVALPCAAVMRRQPDLDAVQRALHKLPRGAARWERLRRAGPLHRAGALWFQLAGADPAAAAAAIQASVRHGKLPECLRAAHLIAAGVVTGQSGRRA